MGGLAAGPPFPPDSRCAAASPRRSLFPAYGVWLRRGGPCFLAYGFAVAVVVIGVIGVGYTLDVVVLDGEVAVPCNPQSAPAGSNSRLRASRVE